MILKVRICSKSNETKFCKYMWLFRARIYLISETKQLKRLTFLQKIEVWECLFPLYLSFLTSHLLPLFIPLLPLLSVSIIISLSLSFSLSLSLSLSLSSFERHHLFWINVLPSNFLTFCVSLSLLLLSPFFLKLSFAFHFFFNLPPFKFVSSRHSPPLSRKGFFENRNLDNRERDRNWNLLFSSKYLKVYFRIFLWKLLNVQKVGIHSRKKERRGWSEAMLFPGMKKIWRKREPERNVEIKIHRCNAELQL